MKAILEVLKLNSNDVVTTSPTGCDYIEGECEFLHDET